MPEETVKLVGVNKDGQIYFYEISKEELENSDGTYTPEQLAQVCKNFDDLTADLRRMDDPTYRAEHAAEFLRVNRVWLANLAKDGFAINYRQFVTRTSVSYDGPQLCHCGEE